MSNAKVCVGTCISRLQKHPFSKYFTALIGKEIIATKKFRYPEIKIYYADEIKINYAVLC